MDGAVNNHTVWVTQTQKDKCCVFYLMYRFQLWISLYVFLNWSTHRNQENSKGSYISREGGQKRDNVGRGVKGKMEQDTSVGWGREDRGEAEIQWGNN